MGINNLGSHSAISGNKITSSRIKSIGKRIMATSRMTCTTFTPPYGLCLLISAAIGGVNVVQVMRDVAIILLPMLLILLLVILFPEIALWLPRLLMPKTFT